ncbi:MAG: tRNA lysidine(34) synthetase TilS [Candidatus Marinimicrobia bacterium]|nr:tRNA lysidine(34) synthetase TilS [Candidatus Neomarinimicrobiota bacterium]MBL7010007.1 tRNA lysidine(34) synthetase TilS [Candidatus Neomarinimicrobiota bacterium]MBL7029717.1 tRNA lysidine(34) synthetase TilS [Candidatus Neomarinimicrobiota bacterium]
MDQLIFSGFYQDLAPYLSEKKKTHFLVAVSGGMDSVCLLNLMTQLGKTAQIIVSAIHVNHGIRSASRDEEKFVRGLCFDLDVPLTVVQAEGKPKKGESMEMWARRIRKEAFDSTGQKMNCDFILTAHHANDNIETILMHLDDGCGIEGLRSIPQKNGQIIRPLLKISRSAIEAYVHFHSLTYMEDESNKDVSIRRNYVRHKIVTPWADQASHFVSRFNDLSQKATESVTRMNWLVAKFSEQVEDRYHQKLIHDTLSVNLSANQLVRLVKHIMGETDISWRRHRWEALNLWFLSPKTGSTFKLNNQWTILRDRYCYILNHEIQKKIDLPIQRTGCFGSDGFSISLNHIEVPAMDSNPFHEVIDGSILEGKHLSIRSWKYGDVFQPLGMEGHKKVSDFLVDEKVDCFAKEKQLVLTANEEIIWVCGRRLSDKAKITDFTQEFLELSMNTRVGVS